MYSYGCIASVGVVVCVCVVVSSCTIQLHVYVMITSTVLLSLIRISNIDDKVGTDVGIISK